MPTLRERFTDIFFGEERRRLEERQREMLRIMTNAYQAGPWELPPEELARQLREQDPYLLDFMLSQLGWEVIGGYGLDTEAERQRAVRESVRLYRYSPLAQWTVWLWTDWGLGDKVTVTPADTGAAEVWEEFWKAERNAPVLGDDKIKELSRWLLLKGNRFLAYYSSDFLDGEATVRTIKPDEMTLVTNPEDDSEVWFYKRQWTPTGQAQRTWYYPDWSTFFSDELEDRWDKVVKANSDIGSDATRADRVNGEQQLGDDSSTNTDVCIQFVPHNIKDEDSLLGWPILTAAFRWIRGHGDFAEARLSVAQAVAAYVRRYKHQGGSRAQDSLVATIRSALSQSQMYDTNAPPAPGSSEVVNKAVEVQDLTMKTGALDAKADNEMFVHMAALGGGLFPTSLGLDTARWATALEMDKAQSMLFQQYQTFWATQFRTMVKIVLSFQEKYGEGSFEDKSAEVNVDSFNLADFPAMAGTIGTFFRDALTPSLADGSVPEGPGGEIVRMLLQKVLQALGVDKAEDLTSKEEWEKARQDEEEEEPTPPSSQFQFQPGQQPPQQELPEEEEVARQIAAAILGNAKEGTVDWERVAEWALAEKMEGTNGMDQHQG